VLYDKKALKPIGNTAIDTKNEAIAYTLTKVPTKNYSLLKMKKQIAAIFILVLFTSTFSIAQVPKLIGEYLVGIRNNDNIHISPDGTKLLTKSTYGVTLRNLLNDSVVTYFDDDYGFDNRPISAIFSPDSKMVLISSFDTIAKLYDLEGNLLTNFGRRRRTDGIRNFGYQDSETNNVRYLNADWKINSIVFSPDSKKILVAEDYTTAKIFDVRGKHITTLVGNNNELWYAVFSPDGQSVLTASEDNSVKIWDLNGNVKKTLRTKNGNISSAVFSSDGTKVLTASSDASFMLHNLNNNDTWTYRWDNIDFISSAVFSPNGQEILLACGNNTAMLCDLSGNVITTFKGHIESLNSAVFSPDGTKVLTASNDKTAKLWDLNGNTIYTFRGHVEGVYLAGFSPDGNKIFTSSNDSSSDIWELKEPKLINAFKNARTGLWINSTDLSPDRSKILTLESDEKKVKLWDLNGNIISTINIRLREVIGGDIVAFSPNNQMILTANRYGKKVKLWDLNGKKINSFKVNEIRSAVFSPDGKKILIASGNRSVKQWDLDGKLTNTPINLDFSNSKAYFSPDGEKILTTSYRTMSLWNLDGNLIKSYNFHSDDVLSAVFSTNGTKVLTASNDHTAKLWDTKGFLITNFLGHKNSVLSAVFSPNGSKILTVSNDNTAKLWDLNGSVIYTFYGYDGTGRQINSADFLGDGTQILIGTNSGPELWDLPSYSNIDIDREIPSINGQDNKNRFALIIGNEQYDTINNENNVDFAKTDAATFKKYCRNIFKVPENQILYLENANLDTMKQKINELKNFITQSQGKAEVLFFYAGQGLAVGEKQALVPIGNTAQDTKNCLKIEAIADTLAKVPHKKIMMLVNTCFTGLDDDNKVLISNSNTKGPITVALESQLHGNTLLVSSSYRKAPLQTSSPQKHDYFTYYLLKTINENAENTDFSTLQLLGSFLKQIRTKSLSDKQTTQIQSITSSPSLQDAWKGWKWW